jgi:hypothetical protein
VDLVPKVVLTQANSSEIILTTGGISPFIITAPRSQLTNNTQRRSIMLTKNRLFLVLGCIPLLAGFLIAGTASAADEFPQSNAWFQATPSVVWCGDRESTTTLEVHIVGRNDVARVWFTDLGTTDDEHRAELFDDGTHGDPQAGDNVFTLSEVVVPCNPASTMMDHGWNYDGHFLRVELDDGQQLGNNYPLAIGLVDPAYKDGFEVTELAPGITATAYAAFIEDSNHQVIDNYPVATVYCGTSNYNAYRKLYSVLPDIFDIAIVQPGMQIFRPSDLAENVPYNVMVSNEVEHIGVDIFDNTAAFGSGGFLKSAIYSSFSSVDVLDHEFGHTWGPAIGQSLGLLAEQYTSAVNQAHWSEYADMEGQMGYFYFDDSGAVGHFSHQEDGTWELVSNFTPEPYSPLELYTMGLIPASEVPPVHILTDPDTTDLKAITAASVKTVTIEEIITAEGGERVPSAAESQKDFRLAFIVTQDRPYDDAAYAFFSLMSYHLTNQNPPSESRRFFAPFYWATGGRGTLETHLPLELAVPVLPGQAEPEAEETEVPTPETAGEPTAPPAQPTPTEASETELDVIVAREENQDTQKTPGCSLLPLGLIAIPALLARRRKNGPQDPA